MQPESSDSENLICLFITAFVFYGFCFAIGDVRASVPEYIAFFTYLAVMSLAILVTSYRFYGRILIYLSYPLTWLIFGAWFASNYNPDEHFLIAVIFAGVYFAIYYVATLVYRLVTDEIGMIENTGLVLTNSFVFYGFGYAIIDSREALRGIEGLFTAGHAAFHSLVSQTVSRLKPSSIDVVQVLAILILTFATIAIPVQFDGNFVTLIWSVEAAALFWFGRWRLIQLFEYFSYPVMILATVSLCADWMSAFLERSSNIASGLRPLANGDFITGLVFVAAFAFIYYINRDERNEPAIGAQFVRAVGYAVACVGLIVLYNTFRIEISNYFHFLAITADGKETGIPLTSLDSDLGKFNIIWQLNYTMFFLTALSIVNLRKVRSVILANASVGFSVLSLLIFVTAGMQLFHELRQNHMLRIDDGATLADPMNIAIRYISYLFVAALLYVLFRYSRTEMMTASIPAVKLGMGFDGILFGAVLIAISCDLVNVLRQLDIADSTKLGLSIFWAVYVLFLIALGIAKEKKYLRIAAIVLLGVTLTKLFLYDIADLPTIPKTILFVSVGLLMLVVSFLYNKYTGSICRTEASQDE